MKLSILLSTFPLALAFPLQLSSFSDGFGSMFPSKVKDSLVLLSDSTEPVFVSDSDKSKLKREGINFLDITHHASWFKAKDEIDVPVYGYPAQAQHNSTVSPLLTVISQQNMHDNLAKFTSFYTRYYKSETGYESALWLYEKLESIVAANKHITMKKVHHKGWKQFSIIVRIPGSENPDNIVVVGSHQDSMNLLLPNLLKAPGADDNGSGTVTCIEALRILVDSGYQPKNTVEFHFYSAEEGGLLGSMDVFSRYREQKKRVVAMLQQDMTGYIQRTLDAGEPESVGVITDYVTPGLVEFVKMIIDSYLSIGWVETKCGYACSDHGSASNNGYPSAFVIESDFKLSNNYIHSTMDTLDRLSFSHMAEHCKLVLGYAVELGEHVF